jgi:hypothetical protein
VKKPARAVDESRACKKAVTLFPCWKSRDEKRGWGLSETVVKKFRRGEAGEGLEWNLPGEARR